VKTVVFNFLGIIMSANVSDVMEDIVMTCMPSTCDVEPYHFEPLAADAVPSQSVRESLSEASDSDGSGDEDESEMTAVAVQEVSDWYVTMICCTLGASSIPIRCDRRRRRIVSGV